MSNQRLSNKRILLGVTGGIAAYKSAELIRRLQDQGADVRVIMTQAATEFITPLTLQALSGHPVSENLLDTETESVMGHIELARWADLVLVAPATADFLARFCNGRGDDLLTTVCLAAECKIALAPAMNQAMWANAQTQQNILSLENSQVTLLGPDAGLQACGEVGLGRLLDIDKIVDRCAALFQTGSLSGKHLVITAGPTREAIDPVRYISNHSSGKQGYALATAAIEAGATVTLISGPTNLEVPARVEFIPVISADDMYKAVFDHINRADIFIGVAAVADFKPAAIQDQKIKKDKQQTQQTMVLKLVENPDIIASVAALTDKPFCVGFAAETENLLQYARAKLKQKNLDMIVANNVADNTIGFNSDNNATTIISDDSELQLAMMSKQTLSNKIIQLISEKVASKQ